MQMNLFMGLDLSQQSEESNGHVLPYIGLVRYKKANQETLNPLYSETRLSSTYFGLTLLFAEKTTTHTWYHEKTHS